MSPASKPTILFLSPAIPKSTGIGISMRAAAMLQALRALAPVNLVVVNLTKSDIATAIPAETAALCRDHLLLDPARPTSYAEYGLTEEDFSQRALRQRLTGPPTFLSQALCRRIAASLPAPFSENVRAVFSFRLATAPLAVAVKQQQRLTCPMLLDLDDYESKARGRMADILRRQNGKRWYLEKKYEALQYRLQEGRYIPLFDRGFISAVTDLPALSARFGDRFTTLPNTVALPPPAPDRNRDDSCNILFVGACSYPPNQDGIRFFLDQVLPRIRQAASRPFRVMIVGRRTSDTLADYSDTANVDLIGEVPDVADYYRQAHMAIAPIRVGGGTRIKILEALSYRVPVVATPIGAEGIALIDGDNMLIGEDPQAFADACLRLMNDPGLRARLAENGYALVAREYSSDVIRKTIARALTMGQEQRQD